MFLSVLHWGMRVMKITALSGKAMVARQRTRAFLPLPACSAAVLAAALLCLALAVPSAQARSVQWIWKNEHGVKVYSDMPPPAHISGKNILKSPHRAVVQRRRAAANTGPVGLVDAKVARGEVQAAPDGTGTEAGAAGKKQGGAQESELDKKVARKREQEEATKKAEAKKQQAREAQEERERREKQEQNCRRIDESRRNLTSGARVSTTDAKGERRFLSEQEIQGRLDRLDDAAQANDC